MNRTFVSSALWLLGSLGLLCAVGCELFQQKETPCSDRRPCQGGDVCDPQRAVCVPAMGSQDLAAEQDMTREEDMTAAPDLAMPDLAMPDLKPECTTESECAAGLACLNQKCAPCTQDGDCLSLICDVYQTAMFGGSTVRGRCIPRSEVVYADHKDGACLSQDGSEPAKPVCTLQEAVDKLDGTKKYVWVKSRNQAYGRFTTANRAGTIYAEGPGVLIGLDTANPSVSLSGSADLVLQGVEVVKGSNGVVCTGPGPKIKLRRVKVSGSIGTGLVASQCAVEVDRSFFAANDAGALRLTDVANYVITSSFFVQNGKAVGPSAIRFEGTCTGTFRFNTVADNSSNIQGGIACNANVLEIRDSIVVGNKLFPNVGGSQFLGNCMPVKTVVGGGDLVPGGMTMNPEFEAPMNQDYRLKSVPANDACCVDKASNAASAALPVDYFGNRRPDCTTNKCDIGAHELK